MSDLNTMFNNGMGSLGALSMGQADYANRAKQAQALQYEQQKMQQEAQLHPLVMQQKQATLDQMAAQLPGVQGQSQSLAAAGEMDQATKSHKIAAKVSEMADQIGDDGMKTLGRDGDRVLAAIPVIKQYPVAMQKQVYAKYVEQYGGSLKSPMVQGIMSAPDAEFASALEAMGTGLATASKKYIQDSGLKKQENDSQEKIATDRNASAERIAQLQADARIKAAESRSELAMSKMSSDQKIAYLTSIPPEERTPAESNQLNELSKQRLAERTVGNPNVAPAVLGQPSNLATGQAAADALFPRQAAPKPTAPASDLQSAVKAAGYPYEPNKYNYRIDPATGLAQRAPK